MVRKHNTTREGNNWSSETINAVWEKGRVIPDYDSDTWRWDKCGKVMKHSEYGNRDSKYGWEIDHIIPVAHNGGDIISNLQPLNWENNAKKADNLNWNCGN